MLSVTRAQASLTDGCSSGSSAPENRTLTNICGHFFRSLRASTGLEWPGEDWVRAMEKGRPSRFELLEDAHRRVLRTLQVAADATYELRDWERYTRQMVHFHLKNAASWGNARTGADLAAQVDPGFVLREGAGVPV